MADAASTIPTTARNASLKGFRAGYLMMISLFVVQSRYTNQTWPGQCFLVVFCTFCCCVVRLGGCRRNPMNHVNIRRVVFGFLTIATAAGLLAGQAPTPDKRPMTFVD